MHIASAAMRLMNINTGEESSVIANTSRRKGVRNKELRAHEDSPLVAQIQAQGSFRQLRGKVQWDGKVLQSRTRRSSKLP